MSAAVTQVAEAAPPALPIVGMSRWQQLRHFVPVSRETWRKLGLAGRAPAAIRLSDRCSLYPNTEVHRWLADPVGYRAEGGAV